jgi:cold shock protein
MSLRRDFMTLQGTVKQWDDAKGWGFIVPEGGGADVFVHFREVEVARGKRRSLDFGQRVEYEIYDTGRGPRARNVRAV